MLYNQFHKGLFRVKLVPTAKKLMPDIEVDIAVESYSYKTMKQDRNMQKRPHINMRMRSF